MSKRDVYVNPLTFNHKRALIGLRVLDKAPPCKPFIVQIAGKPTSMISHFPMMPFLTYCGVNAARIIGGQAPVIHGAN